MNLRLWPDQTLSAATFTGNYRRYAGLNADKYMHRVESEFETEPDLKARRIAL